MKPAEFEKVSGYPLELVKKLREDFKSIRKSSKLEGLWNVLDAYDSGEFWDVMRAKLPKHQVIPDTNMIYYIKNNLINSIYAAPYIADVFPLDPEEKDVARNLNKFIEFVYNDCELGYKQLKISNNTALLNVGFLQVGWDNSVHYGSIDNKGKGPGGMVFLPRDIMSVLLDPNFDDFQKGRAAFISTEESIENLKATYQDAIDDIEEYLAIKNKDKKEKVKIEVSVTNTASPDDVGKQYTSKDMERDQLGMLPVWIAYKKVVKSNGDLRIDQIIYTSGDIVLDYKKDIRPRYFPIVALYSEPPEKNPYGIGVPRRILKNSMALNILNSVAITHTYASQRTPWIFDMDSGISIRRVQRDLNKPDAVLPARSSDITKVLHRLEYPKLPDNLEFIKSTLEADIEKISGVDEKYTGRDTASVTTTGGMERLQGRVSMSDNIRISMIEKYSRDLTKIILDFHTEHGGEYEFLPTNSKEEAVKEALKIDFKKLKKENKGFWYSINASPLLPKTRARLADSANIIMQTQLQFAQAGQQVQLLTEEEWLFFQDLPQKDMILDRMKIERLRNDKEEIASELTSFSAMTEQGMRPESAIEQLANERQMRRDPTVRKNILGKM